MRRIQWSEREPEPCPHCAEWKVIAVKAIRTAARVLAVCERSDRNFDELDGSHKRLQEALEQALAANERLTAMLRAVSEK